MKGIYLLIIEIKKQTRIKVGALGFIQFKKGIYYYVGSAQNNLEKRVQRHLKKEKKLHWHIDYLLKNKNTRIKKVLIKIANKDQECITAKKLKKTETSIPKFGCSDCKCSAHLFKIRYKNIKLKGFKEFLLR